MRTISLRRMSLGQKLYGSFGFTLAVAAVLGVVVITSMGSMNQSSDRVTNTAYPSVGAVDDMTTSIETLVRHQREHLTTPGAADKALVATQIQVDRKTFIGAAARFASLPHAPGDISRMATVRSLFTKYLAETAPFVGLSDAGKTQPATQMLASSDGTFSSIEATLGKLAQSQDRSASQATAAVASSYTTARTLTLALLGFLLVAVAVVAYLLTRGIRNGVRPVLDRLQMLQANCATDLRAGLERMAQGDLTYEITPVTPPIENIGGDEIGRIGEAVNAIRDRTVASVAAYNETRASLTRLVTSMQEASNMVSSASVEMASTSEETGRAVGEIANAINDVAAGAERQVQMVGEARSSTEQTGEAAAQASVSAREGVAASQQASAAMDDLRQSTAEITTAISGLSNKSQQIGGIVDAITAIAGQTNLLALNAAIEAARAGEQGRGFAVVAEEVRKLAEESQKAAKSIGTLVEEIQTETARTVRVVEQGAAKADQSAQTVDTTREAFQQIDRAVDEMLGRITEVAEATNQVAAVAEESSASTEQISASTEETSASAQQIAASAQELARTADELQRLIAQFTIA
jgi:methyl-accepting chemotaxis protein